MSATDQFFTWYFEGLSGLGGWIIFLLLAFAAVAWLIYDSQSRRIPALGWVMGAVLLTLLVFPSLIYRFVSADTRLTLDQFKEVFFYVGLLGGIIPAVVAVGYFVNFRGLRGCSNGHLYDASLQECPVCAAEKAPSPGPMGYSPPPVYPFPEPRRENDETDMPRPEPRRQSSGSRRDRAGAWLVDTANQHRHELFMGDNRVGRKAAANEVVLSDPTVGREHFLIRATNGHYVLYDRGSKTGTYINGKRLRGPMTLEAGDEIMAGETTLKFVAS